MVEVLSLVILLLLCLSEVGRKVSGKSESEEETVGNERRKVTV